MSEKLKPWTVTQLARAMEEDLGRCHTDLERQTLTAICGIEIRELAEQLSAVRKLTPGEVAIASQYGFRR